MTDAPEASRTGFTLTELLAVLAIVVILLMLLIPGLLPILPMPAVVPFLRY